VVGAPATSLTTVKLNLIRANGELSPTLRISPASLFHRWNQIVARPEGEIIVQVLVAI